MHSAFQCFWKRRPPDLHQLVDPLVMFPATGVFRGTLRVRMDAINQINVWTEFGYEPVTGGGAASRRPLASGEGSSSQVHQPVPRRAANAAKPDYT